MAVDLCLEDLVFEDIADRRNLSLDYLFSNANEQLLCDIDHFIFIDVIFIILVVIVLVFTLLSLTARQGTLRAYLLSWTLFEFLVVVVILITVVSSSLLFIFIDLLSDALVVFVRVVGYLFVRVVVLFVVVFALLAIARVRLARGHGWVPHFQFLGARRLRSVLAAGALGTTLRLDQ